MLCRMFSDLLLLFCLLLFESTWIAADASTVIRGTGTSLQIPIRISRLDGHPDRFATGRNFCKSATWCGSIFPKAITINVTGEVGDCVCQCPLDYPLFQDDVATCVQKIPESAGCPTYSLTNAAQQEILNPVVQLPPYGQLISWKINTVVPGQKCWIDDSSGRYLASDGWNPLSAIRLGNQAPRFRLMSEVSSFGDPSSTGAIGIQWLGSSEHADFLQGRIILLTLSCNGTGLLPLSLCYPMRIAGNFGRLKSLPLMDAAGQSQQSGGDNVETGILVAAACGGALGVLYVIVLAIFITSRMRKNRLAKDTVKSSLSENGDINRTDLERDAGKVTHGSFVGEYNASLYSAWPEDVAFRHRLMLRNRGVSSLSMRYLYTPPPFFLNDVMIVQTPSIQSKDAQMQDVILERIRNKSLPKQPARRRKVLFDPRFFELEHLKDPPREAETFRAQVHCMINITKSRLDKRKYLPNLEIIAEENRHSPENSGVLSVDHQKVSTTPIMSAEPTLVSSRTIKELDAVILQVRKAEVVLKQTDPTSNHPTTSASDWSQVLKDEWGSNESLAKIPHRRRIHEVFQKNSAGKNSLREIRGKAVDAEKNSQKLKIDQMPDISKSQSDDEESDKASSRSGTGSNPETKDSGIEDDSSDKPVKASNPKSKTEMPAMISRKKIVSANAGNTFTPKTSLKSRQKSATS